jgi:hypothetical protein
MFEQKDACVYSRIKVSAMQMNFDIAINIGIQSTFYHTKYYDYCKLSAALKKAFDFTKQEFC